MIPSLIAYAFAFGIAAATPGPGVTALVGQSMGNGLKAACFLMAGIALGDVVYMTVAIAGLAAIAQAFSGAFLVVKILGGLYLLYLGYKFWKSGSSMTETETSRKRTNVGAFCSGFAITMGNPKTIVFHLALLPTVLDLQRVSITQWAVLVLVTIVVLCAVQAPYAILASQARGRLTQAGAMDKLNQTAGAIIAGTGTLVLWQCALAFARRA